MIQRNNPGILHFRLNKIIMFWLFYFCDSLGNHISKGNRENEIKYKFISKVLVCVEQQKKYNILIVTFSFLKRYPELSYNISKSPFGHFLFIPMKSFLFTNWDENDWQHIQWPSCEIMIYNTHGFLYSFSACFDKFDIAEPQVFHAFGWQLLDWII